MILFFLAWAAGVHLALSLFWFAILRPVMLEDTSVSLAIRSLIWPYYFYQFLFGDDNEPQDPYTF